jgi:hypothetical protein
MLRLLSAKITAAATIAAPMIAAAIISGRTLFFGFGVSTGAYGSYAPVGLAPDPVRIF